MQYCLQYLVFFRLFRFIGGKGFDCYSAKNTKRFKKANAEKWTQQIDGGDEVDPKCINSSLMLRTLECCRGFGFDSPSRQFIFNAFELGQQ